MKRVIFDRNNIYDKDFLDFLKLVIKNELYKRLDYRKLEASEIYINNYTKYPTVFKPYISSYDIVVSGIENLEVSKVNGRITLDINQVEIFPGTSAKLYELCKLINNGVLVVLKGYPIFTETFEYIRKHIDEYYDFYIDRGV